MPEKSFRFKQFTIAHDKSTMKVGTDGVLLGAWTKPENSVKTILDIGTGTGLIALMLAQKTSKNVRIDALDFDQTACDQAIENVQKSPWPDKVSVINSSIQEFAKNTKKKYDLIVTNPPYFEMSSNPLNKTHNTAKHAVTLTLSALADAVQKLLTPDGTLSIILPVDRGQIFVNLAQNNGFCCFHKVYVKPNYYKPYERMLIQFSFDSSRNKKVDEMLLIEKETRHQYSEKYIQLTKDYYLAF